MSKRRSNRQHLAIAREHLRILQEHLNRGSLDDALVRDAVSHRLEVAIDVTAKVSADLLHAEAPQDWPKIVAMRNILAHQYADLDQEILQNTIDNRLDGFIQLVERLQQAATAGGTGQSSVDPAEFGAQRGDDHGHPFSSG